MKRRRVSALAKDRIGRAVDHFASALFAIHEWPGDWVAQAKSDMVLAEFCADWALSELAKRAS